MNQYKSPKQIRREVVRFYLQQSWFWEENAKEIEKTLARENVITHERKFRETWVIRVLAKTKEHHEGVGVTTSASENFAEPGNYHQSKQILGTAPNFDPRLPSPNSVHWEWRARREYERKLPCWFTFYDFRILD